MRTREFEKAVKALTRKQLKLYLQQQGFEVSGSKQELAVRPVLSFEPQACWDEVWGREYSSREC